MPVDMRAVETCGALSSAAMVTPWASSRLGRAALLHAPHTGQRPNHWLDP
jgi:hypothetical protein